MPFDGFDNRFTALSTGEDPRFQPVSEVQVGVFTGKAGGIIIAKISRYKILNSPWREFLIIEQK